MTKVSHQSYGKSRVRLSHVDRHDARHEFCEMQFDISLAGDFRAAYEDGDNRLVLPTDTMKNTVYALAARAGVESLEGFSRQLAEHFTNDIAQVTAATVRAEQVMWKRMGMGGKPHDHAFSGGSGERHTCDVIANDRQPSAMRCGFKGLQVLKTTGSAFAEFYRDEYTSLADTDDRIFATTIAANWPCSALDADWSAHRQAIRAALMDVFANHFSKSVQHTLYEMAGAAFDACAGIDEITIAMPNQHHLLADLTKLGIENPNTVFMPTDAPFGMIEATVSR